MKQVIVVNLSVEVETLEEMSADNILNHLNISVEGDDVVTPVGNPQVDDVFELL